MAGPRSSGLRPAVARAMTSPSGLAAAAAGGGVGAALGILVPLGGPVLAVPFALLGWAARVAAAIPRKGTALDGRRIDPFALAEPWRHWVQGTLQARARFERTVASVAPGPLQDRLREIGTRLDTGVEEGWRVAQRGQSLVEARRQIDPGGARRRLDAVRSELAPGPDDPEGTDRTPDHLSEMAQAIESQVGSAERLDAVIERTQARLRLLDARIAEAVARTIELSVQADTPQHLGRLGADIDGVVLEMEALRQALEETGGGGGPSLPPAPGP